MKFIYTLLAIVLLSNTSIGQADFFTQLDSINNLRNNKTLFTKSIRSLEKEYKDSLKLCQYQYKFYKVMGRFYFNVLDDNLSAINVQRDSVLPAQIKCLEPGDHQIAITHFNIGLAYEFHGDLIAAEKHYNKVLEIENKASIPHRSSYHRYSFIADFYRRKGDSQKAKFYLSKARKLCTKPQLGKKYVLLLHSEARLLMEEKRHQQAISKMLVILNSLDSLQISDPNLTARVCEDLAREYRNLGKYDSAEKYINKAMKISSSNEKASQEMINRHLYRKSYILKSKGEFEESLNLLFALKESFSKDDYDPTLNELSGNNEDIADVYFESGQLKKALAYYQKGIKYLVQNVDDDYYINPSISQEQIIDLDYLRRQFGLKAKCLYELGRRDKDTKAFYSTIDAVQKYDSLTKILLNEDKEEGSLQTSLERARIVYQFGINSSIELFKLTGNRNDLKIAYSFIAKLKAQILSREIKLRKRKEEVLSDSLRKVEKGLLKNIQEAKKKYEASLFVEKDFHKSIYFDDYFKIKGAYESFKVKNGIGLIKPDTAYQMGTNINEVQQKLQTNEALLEFHVGENFTYLFLITCDSFHFAKNTYESQKLLEFYNQIISNSIIDPPDIINSIALLLEKLSLDIENLIVIADENFLQIPIELIHLSRDYILLDRFNISYDYTSQFLFKNKEKVKSNKIAAFACDYSNERFKDLIVELDYLEDQPNIGYLKHTISEAENVLENMEGTLYVNDEANKSMLYKSLDNHGIFHFALHGILNHQFPDQSALVFQSDKNDFLLTAGEIYNMKIPSQLTVLSACNSGKGPIKIGDGVRSLTRSFIVAGSEAVLTSLWDATDHSTNLIIDKFYYYLNKGEAKNIALTKAKQDYLRDASPSFKHPKFWAHLILVGDVSPITSSSSFLWLALIVILLFSMSYFFLKRLK